MWDTGISYLLIIFIRFTLIQIHISGQSVPLTIVFRLRLEKMAFRYEVQLQIFLISSRGEPTVDGPQNEG